MPRGDGPVHSPFLQKAPARHHLACRVTPKGREKPGLGLFSITQSAAVEEKWR